MRDHPRRLNRDHRDEHACRGNKNTNEPNEYLVDVPGSGGIGGAQAGRQQRIDREEGAVANPHHVRERHVTRQEMPVFHSGIENGLLFFAAGYGHRGVPLLDVPLPSAQETLFSIETRTRRFTIRRAKCSGRCRSTRPKRSDCAASTPSGAKKFLPRSPSHRTTPQGVCAMLAACPILLV